MLKLRNRVVILFAILCVLITAMIVRLGYIHIVWAPELEAHAKSQQNKEIPIKAKRGDLMDRKGNKLAFSISTYTIWADTQSITKPHETAKLLAETIDIEEQVVTDVIVKKASHYVKVAKGLNKTDADLVRSKGIWGLSIEEETKRIYPYGSLAAHVIGNVYSDQNGYLGLEMYYNEMLSGVPGLAKITTDVHGRQLAHGEEYIKQPINGKNIMLTLDDTIQYFVEERLKQTSDAYKPLSVNAIVMDPRNGEVIAMATYPTYDLNYPYKPLDEEIQKNWETMKSEERSAYLNKMWKNAIVSEVYEPGSVMKIFTAAVALEEGVVNLNDHFYCNGYKMVGKTKLKCIDFHKGGHGDQTFLQGFANSCNPVFIEIIQRMKPESFFKYFDALEIPGKTGIDVPSEAKGLLINRDQIKPLDYATLSYGHGMSLNMIQVASMVSTLVNNGDFIQPHFVKGYYDGDKLVETFKPQVKKNVFSERTVKAMRELMTYAVEHKYTKSVKLEGVKIGGKTGTSVKIVDGKYSNDHVISSFTGVFPMDAPEYVIYVTVDEPNVDVTKIPVSSLLGRSIVDDILRYKNIVPKAEEKKQVKVPEVSGLSLVEAKEALAKAKLEFATEPMELEEGVAYKVKDQFPKQSALVDEGSTIILSVEEE